MELFVGRYEDLRSIIRILRDVVKGSKVLGYRVVGEGIGWGEISDINDLPLDFSDIQKPGFYRLSKGIRFRHSFVSPKLYLHPPEQLISLVLPNYRIVDYDLYIDKVILFGIKPCDLRAISVLDSILGLNKHPIYTRMRSSIVGIVVEECLEPGETCFCGAVGAGPNVLQGFDIAYARFREDLVLFKYGSDIGKEVISRANLVKADRNIVSLYQEFIDRCRKTTETRIPNINEIKNALKKSMNNTQLWSRLSSKCVGCGNCNYVCPTCFCIEIEDIVSDGLSKRIAKWIGCLTYTYGQVAGGHFRPRLYTRYRHFVLHKFLFYPMQINYIGCVGCGRCITWCPLGIDIRDTLREVVKNG
ncbi:MAG: 4Fe-4S dicluster domain-containing protein [Ignisphaera sp.]